MRALRLWSEPAQAHWWFRAAWLATAPAKTALRSRRRAFSSTCPWGRPSCSTALPAASAARTASSRASAAPSRARQTPTASTPRPPVSTASAFARMVTASRAENDEGDSRCTPSGVPSDSAFLQVERAGKSEGDYLALHVESSGDANPLPLLQAKLTAWRAQHACPQRPSSTQSGSSESEPTDDAACACRVTAQADGAATWALIGALFVVARWRRAARQLRPTLLARQQASATIPRRHDADLCAHEVHRRE